MSTSLTDRHVEATKALILGSAIKLLEGASVSELTARAAARHAGMSERTIFRYFTSREQFLDAVAMEVAHRIQAPPAPDDLTDLPLYPKALYSRFEEQAGLVKAALHTELYERVREHARSGRWRAVAELIEDHAARGSPRKRKIAIGNICYYLTASTWHYYRFYLGFTLDETAEAAGCAIRLTITDLLTGSHRDNGRGSRDRSGAWTGRS